MFIKEVRIHIIYFLIDTLMHQTVAARKNFKKLFFNYSFKLVVADLDLKAKVYSILN